MNLVNFPLKKQKFQGFFRHLYDAELTSSLLKFNTSGYSEDRKPENIVNYSGGFYTSNYDSSYGQFVSIELQNMYFDINAYEIESNGPNFPLDWDFSVSHDGKNWIDLHKPRGETSLNGSSGELFKIKGGFAKFFKWTNRGPNNNGLNNCFYIGKVDIYGSMVKCNTKVSCNIVPHIIPRTFFHFKIQYITFIFISVFYI